MPTQNVICIVVDRLHAGMIGAYGNSWLRTAALDALSCRSFVFDQAVLDCPRLDALYRAYWWGRHAADRMPEPEGALGLPQLLSGAGMHTALVTDEPAVARLPAAADFSETVFIEPPRIERTAADVSETCLGRLFGAAAAWLPAARGPFCLWIHARGMGAPWDAPLQMRDQFAEEDDPRPPRIVSVPDYWLAADADPDKALGIRHAYAAQVALLDLCLGGFCEALDQSPLAANTQLTFLSARGFPLGIHRRIGPCDEALYNETVQVAWMMRFPDGLGSSARSQALVQPPQLPGTLLDWLEIDRGRLAAGSTASLLGVVRGDVESRADRALMVSEHDRAIRTPAWHLRLPRDGAAELYAKPSDRWEVNEVSKILPDVVAALEHALDETEAAGPAAALAPLPELLTSEVD